ncbi:MAG: hypothetical protein ACXW31_00935 [Thermoanaerobaculia bacterium]
MLLAAAILTLGVSIEIDLRALIDLAQRKQQRTSITGPKVTCGIKVVGYHIAGRPGQQFEYAGETFTIPREGFIEVISLPRVHHYSVDGRKLPLEDGVSPLDGFSFRWITLPTSPIRKENPNHE